MIAVSLTILALFVYFSSLPEVDTDKEEADVVQGDAPATSKRSVLQFPHLLLGAITLFLYVGVEVLAGDSIISYGSSQGISLETATYFTTATLITMIVGYIVGIICIPKYLSQEKALLYSGVLGTVLSFVVIFTDGYVLVSALALLGLANALVWPAIWPLALADLGRFTKAGSSLLIMGIAGGALIPLLMVSWRIPYPLKMPTGFCCPATCLFSTMQLPGIEQEKHLLRKKHLNNYPCGLDGSFPVIFSA